jgi:dihydrofolate reductase
MEPSRWGTTGKSERGNLTPAWARCVRPRRLFVLSHRPAPEISETQTLVTSGIEDAIAAARAAAGDKDVGLMGGGLVTEALKAGLVDELILHQVPVLLGAGRSFFHELPEHVHLRLLEAVPAPGVTHLRYEVVR